VTSQWPRPIPRRKRLSRIIDANSRIVDLTGKSYLVTRHHAIRERLEKTTPMAFIRLPDPTIPAGTGRQFAESRHRRSPRGMMSSPEGCIQRRPQDGEHPPGRRRRHFVGEQPSAR
jgi:hypothetical protein